MHLVLRTRQVLPAFPYDIVKKITTSNCQCNVVMPSLSSGHCSLRYENELAKWVFGAWGDTMGYEPYNIQEGIYRIMMEGKPGSRGNMDCIRITV